MAPFFELWAEFDGGRFEHLKQNMLGDAKLEWCVEVENRKVFRRTYNKDDIVKTEAEWFSDHAPHKLEGKCKNFVDGASIDFGEVRYIKPNNDYPHIRLRVMPAAGRIYGSDKPLENLNEEFVAARFTKTGPRTPNPSLGCVGSTNATRKTSTISRQCRPPCSRSSRPRRPGSIAISQSAEATSTMPATGSCVRNSRYPATLSVPRRASASRRRITPPTRCLFVIFSMISNRRVRNRVKGDSRERALEIVRRAFETVRFMNVAVMNGNPFRGRDALDLDTMPAEEAFGNQRPLRPVFSPAAADTRASWHCINVSSPL